MKISRLLAGTAVALSLMAGPALADSHAPEHPSGSDRSSDAHGTPGPAASHQAKARAYGRYCQGQSKKHVAGMRGTPFSNCVTAMARLAHGSTTDPRVACKDESKRHVAGQHGTPFSKCVSGGAQLLEDQSHSSGS